MSAVLVPRRVLLTRRAVEELVRLVGTLVPWPADVGTDADDEAGDAAGDALAELHAAGLVRDGRPVADVRAGLEVLHAPEAIVDLDLAVGRAPSYRRLRSWQRWRAGCVATASTAGGRVELAWFDDRLWRGELARAVDVRTPPSTGPPPDDDLRVPHDVLLASGEAVHSDRADLVAELAGRAGTPSEQLRRLHAGAEARLQVTVAGIGRSGRRKAGVVSWVRYAEGWRALTPYLDGGRPMVRVHRTSADRLGVAVAVLVAAVRS